MANKTTAKKETAKSEAVVDKMQTTENAVAEKASATETPKKERTYTQSEIDAIVAEAIKKYAEAQSPVLQVVEDKYVTLMFMSAVAQGTTISLGKLGSINRPGVAQDFPKKDFIAALGTPVVDALLRSRQLLVLNGLDADERERFGLEYKEGEVLSQSAFFKMLDYPQGKMIEVFKQLCPEHQMTVSKIYQEAYFENHDNRIHPDTVKALNRISKASYPAGMFTPILEDMGAKLSE